MTTRTSSPSGACLEPFRFLYIEVEPPHRSSRRTRNRTEKMRDERQDDFELTTKCQLYPCSSLSTTLFEISSSLSDPFPTCLKVSSLFPVAPVIPAAIQLRGIPSFVPLVLCRTLVYRRCRTFSSLSVCSVYLEVDLEPGLLIGKKVKSGKVFTIRLTRRSRDRDRDRVSTEVVIAGSRWRGRCGREKVFRRCQEEG